jgi:hypothetical protein
VAHYKHAAKKSRNFSALGGVVVRERRKEVAVLLRLKERPIIENRRNYPGNLAERLADLLVHGAVAEPDSRRNAFYDVTDGDRVFFIHISPVSGKVLLLATWHAESLPAAAMHASSARSFQASARLA